LVYESTGVTSAENISVIEPPVNRAHRPASWDRNVYGWATTVAGLDPIIVIFAPVGWLGWNVVGVTEANSIPPEFPGCFPVVIDTQHKNSGVICGESTAPRDICALDFVGVPQLPAIDEIDGRCEASNDRSADGGNPSIVTENLQEGVQRPDPYKMQRGALNAFSICAVLWAVYYAWRNL
jgi:hypothetical protein